MNMRFAALAISTALLSACSSAPSNDAWVMQGDAPWVDATGHCMQLRPLREDEKQGFCYDVMTGAYQKRHHYEQLDANEFAFLYPKVQPTPETAYHLAPLPSETASLAASDVKPVPLPYLQQIYTALPFKFNSAHLSQHNRVALHDSFKTWNGEGIHVVSVAITGHTDSKGSQAYNLLLSQWRAQSGAYYMAHLGVSKKDIRQGGVGMLMPHPDAKSDADNRYVDLQLFLQPPAGSDKVAMMDPLALPGL